jgi:DNA primase
LSIKIADLKKKVSLDKVVASYGVKLEKRGNEFWGCCPFHNEKTASFAIKERDGDGVYFCHGCGKGGDIIRFVETIEHCDTKSAIEKLAGKFGVKEKVSIPEQAEPEWNEQYQKVENTFQNPVEEKTKVSFPFGKWKPFSDALLENKEALAYLEKERGITKETADFLHFGYLQSCTGKIEEQFEHVRDKGWILSPRILDGNVVAVKMRSIVEKVFSQRIGMDPKAIFNIDTVNPLEPVFITEGEYDTAALVQAGFCAVSIPNANSTKLSPSSMNILKQAPEIFLAGDNDGKVGNAAMEKLARALGKGAYILLWPEAKDANEYFLKVCNRDVEKFKSDVVNLMEVARSTPVPGFTRASDLLDSTKSIDFSQDPDRLHFPWKPVDDMHYTPLGFLSIIYSTYTGSGKTLFATQVATHEAKRGETVVVYSPEIVKEQYTAVLVAQNLGPQRDNGIDRTGLISVEDQKETKRIFDVTYEAEETMPLADGSPRVLPDWYHIKRGLPDSRLAYYVGFDIPETTTDAILDFIEYTVRVIQPTRFIIDTLHKIVQAPSDENQSQEEARAIKRLEQLGQELGCIFILIGQSTKEGDDLKEVRKDSLGVLRGSREYQDAATSIYLLHRKRVERPASSSVVPDDLLDSKAELSLKKVRFGGKGKPFVYLTYIRKWSRFELLDFQPAPSTENGLMFSGEGE